MMKKNNRPSLHQIIILISFLCFNSIVAQNDTLPAIWIDVVTSTPELIKLADTLEILHKGSPEETTVALDYFNTFLVNSQKDLQDTAVLIFLRYRRSYEYFDWDKKIPYQELFLEDENIPNDSVVQYVNTTLLTFGYKLFPIYHGDLITASIPGYIEEQIEHLLNDELLQFLKLYTEREKYIEIRFSDSYLTAVPSYFGTILPKYETYISQNSFLRYKMSQVYYATLIDFVLGNRDDYNNDYGLFHINDTLLSEIYTNFIKEHPTSKTTWFIKELWQAQKSLSEKQYNGLLMTLLKKVCPPELSNACKTEYFDYDNFEKNITEIIKCYKEEDCVGY